MSINQETLNMIEQAVKDYKTEETSNTFFSLPALRPGAKSYCLMTKTTYMEFNPSKSRARLPSLFARDFGKFLQGHVLLQDPMRNQIQVYVERKNDKIYFTRGWSRIRDFYGMVYGGWVTIVYVSPYLFHVKLRDLAGIEVAYPQSSPPHRLMILLQPTESQSKGPVPYYIAPKTFSHVLEKTMTLCDVESGVMRLGWDGFCKDAFPHQDCQLTFMDWMGFIWKCHVQLQYNSCIVYGEWMSICKTHNLAEGMVVRFGATKPSNNTVIHFKLSPFIGVRTTLIAPTNAGNYKAFYQTDHYYML